MSVNSPKFERIGFGMGLRPSHYPFIFENKPPLDWFEIISENFMDTGGRPVRKLEQILEDYPVVMHGVSLSIGTVDPLNSDYLQKLKTLASWVNPPWISDHLCWTGIAHKNTHDLLPVPYTEEALKNIVTRIRQVQDFLERPIVLENPSTYLEFTSSTMTEWEFIARMAQESGCGLLLDVNNVYVSCYNHRWDPKTYIDALPLDRVAQIHLAGHTNKGTHIIDTHDDHVIDEVWALYRYAISKAGPVSTMVEWDDKIPEFPVVLAEVEKARLWAASSEGPVPIPTFQSFRHNIRPSERLTPLSEQMDEMQNAILEGDGTIMNPDETIVPKPDFSPDEQIRSYINGYRYRLFDIVAMDYDALKFALGRKDFNKLIDDYIETVPSTNFNVARYTVRFPDFVKEHASPFAHELSILETELVQIADAPETTVLRPEDLAALDPDKFMEFKLSPRKALKLFAFSYPVNEFYDAFLGGQEPKIPEKRASFLAIFRHEDSLWRLDLEEREYIVLSSLFAGVPVGEALSAAIPEDEDGEDLMASVQGWFGKWMNNGLLAKAA
ncbi:MAG: DUF692 family protein [Rhodospirillales bacterium]|nr:DUF692 family protein [Rhodospirillales bacterium]